MLDEHVLHRRRAGAVAGWACPNRITGVFQGLLLFALLACDTLIHYRVRLGPCRRAPRYLNSNLPEAATRKPFS